MTTKIQQALRTIAGMLSDQRVIAITIDLDLTKHDTNTSYPCLDVISADILPAGDQELNTADPRTFMYQRRLSETTLETAVFYAIPQDYPIADIQNWADQLAAAPEFNGSILKVEVHTAEPVPTSSAKH